MKVLVLRSMTTLGSFILGSLLTRNVEFLTPSDVFMWLNLGLLAELSRIAFWRQL